MGNQNYNNKLIQKKIKQKQLAKTYKKSKAKPRTNLPLPKNKLSGNIAKGKVKWKIPGVVISSLVVIILVIPSLIVLPFFSGDDYEAIPEESETDLDASLDTDSAVTVSVMRSQTDTIEDVPLETYVTRVVAGEMPAEFEMEALKSQALAARTYIVNQLLYQTEEMDSDVSDTVMDQVYKGDDELRERWGSNYHHNMKKVAEAVAATEGEILTFNNAPIEPQYFSTSNGYTENSEDYWSSEIPYLRSVESPWDKESPYFLDQETFTLEEVESMLEIQLPRNSQIAIDDTRTESNRVKEVRIGEYTFTGREIRDALELRSNDFTIEQKNNHFVFTTKGNGHGVGMSQYGANGMAKEGKTYEDILAYYYQDVEISTVNDSAPALVSK